MIGFETLNPSFGFYNHVWSLTNNSHLQSVSNLQRGQSSDGYIHSYEPPPIELYTQFSLLTYTLLFFGLLLLQSFTIFLVDGMCIKTVTQNTKIVDRILHSIQKSHFPCPYVNWYKGYGTCMDHLKRKRVTEIEVLSTIFINLLFNMVMLFPLGILCKKSEHL